MAVATGLLFLNWIEAVDFDTHDRQKFIDLLEMLSSPEDHTEAFSMIQNAMSGMGWSWNDLVIPADYNFKFSQHFAAEKIESLPICLKYRDKLSQWESEFLDSVQTFSNPTLKQIGIVDKIAAKLKLKGCL